MNPKSARRCRAGHCKPILPTVSSRDDSRTGRSMLAVSPVGYSWFIISRSGLSASRDYLESKLEQANPLTCGPRSLSSSSRKPGFGPQLGAFFASDPRRGALQSAGRCSTRRARPSARLERVKGIEPSYAAWEAAVLPLNYTRAVRRRRPGVSSIERPTKA